jgi:anti-sigma B factor antagonist
VRDIDLTSRSDAAGAWSVNIRGVIDLDTTPELDALLRDLTAAGAALIVLHLGDVEFLDSSGIRTIVTYARRMAEAGGRLLITEASGAVQQVLEIAGVLSGLAQT